METIKLESEFRSIFRFYSAVSRLSENVEDVSGKGDWRVTIRPAETEINQQTSDIALMVAYLHVFLTQQRAVSHGC
jgi:hypothetical protein